MSEAGSSDRSPASVLGEQPTNFFGAQTAKRMDETDTGIELRVTGRALFDVPASDQHRCHLIAIEQVAQLLKAGDLEPIGFINQDQPDRRQGWPPRGDGTPELPRDSGSSSRGTRGANQSHLQK